MNKFVAQTFEPRLWFVGKYRFPNHSFIWRTQMSVKVAINGFWSHWSFGIASNFENRRRRSCCGKRFNASRYVGSLVQIRHHTRSFWWHSRTKRRFIHRKRQRNQSVAKPNPEELPWKDLGIDVVLECTGFLPATKNAKPTFVQVRVKSWFLPQVATTWKPWYST